MAAARPAVSEDSFNQINSASLNEVEWTDPTVRCAVIGLLKEMNQCRLAKLSPLSQPMISNIANSKYSARICPDKCKEFAAWYKEYRNSNKGEENFTDGTPKDARLTFHPVYELPKMRDWYQSIKNPSQATLKYFLDEINNGPVRQQRQKITMSKLKIWWKNERQREKRIQQKKVEKDLVLEGATSQQENISELNSGAKLGDSGIKAQQVLPVFGQPQLGKTFECPPEHHPHVT